MTKTFKILLAAMIGTALALCLPLAVAKFAALSIGVVYVLFCLCTRSMCREE